MEGTPESVVDFSSKKDLELLGATLEETLDQRIARNGETVLPDVFL